MFYEPLLDFVPRLTNLCQSRILPLPCVFRTSLVHMVGALSFCFFVPALLLPLLCASSSCFSFVGLTDDPFLCDKTLLRREQRDAPPESLHHADRHEWLKSGIKQLNLRRHSLHDSHQINGNNLARENLSLVVGSLERRIDLR